MKKTSKEVSFHVTSQNDSTFTGSVQAECPHCNLLDSYQATGEFAKGETIHTTCGECGGEFSLELKSCVIYV